MKFHRITLRNLCLNVITNTYEASKRQCSAADFLHEK